MKRLSIAFVLFAGMAALPVAAEVYFDAAIEEPTGEVYLIEGLVEIEIDDIAWDYKVLQSPSEAEGIDLSESARQGWRLYGPGTPHFGSAKITVQSEYADPLYDWFASASKGQGIRKNISVRLRVSGRVSGREYALMDCFPVQWSATAKGDVKCETITCKMGRVELARTGPDGGGTGGVGASTEDGTDTWNTWGDGEVMQILPGSTAGAKPHTNSPGHKSVGEVTLRGNITDGRKAMCDWINSTVGGKPWKRNLTITEMLRSEGGAKPGKKYNYFDGFPVRYVFPKMSVTNTTGNVEEELRLKFIRLEMK